MTLTGVVPRPRGHDHDRDGRPPQTPDMQRPGAATPGQLIMQHHSAPTALATLSAETVTPPPRVHDVVKIPARAHRVRVPHALLQSRRHSATAIFTYAVADLLAPGRAPAQRAAAGCHTGVVGQDSDGRWRTLPEPSSRQVHPTREWLATRVGLSVGGLDAALKTLSTAHHGSGLGEAHPVYLQPYRCGRRGGGSRAVRTVAACDRYTEIPEWTLGDQRGLLVDVDAWRLYVATVKHRDERGVCRLPAGQLAEVVRVRRQTIPVLLQRLRDAGLIVTVSAPKRPTLILPLMVQVDDVTHRAALADELATACGYLPEGWRSRWSSEPSSDGPVRRGDLGPETGAPLEETHLLQTTTLRHGAAAPPAVPPAAQGGPPARPLLADPFPHGAPWRPVSGPPPQARQLLQQIYARHAARRAADTYRAGLAEAG